MAENETKEIYTPNNEPKDFGYTTVGELINILTETGNNIENNK